MKIISPRKPLSNSFEITVTDILVAIISLGLPGSLLY